MILRFSIPLLRKYGARAIAKHGPRIFKYAKKIMGKKSRYRIQTKPNSCVFRHEETR